MNNEEVNGQMGMDEDVPDFVKQAQEAEEQEAAAAAQAKATAKKTKNKAEELLKKQNDAEDKDEPVDLTPQEKSDKATTTLIKNEAFDHFIASAGNFIDIQDSVNTANAKRCIFSALVKTEEILQENSITWRNVKQKVFMASLVKIALLGLDAEQGEVYPIPYKEGKDVYRIDLQIGYKGERKLRLKYALCPDGDKIVDIEAYLVKEGDKFSVKHRAEGDTFEFDADPFGTGEVKGSFGYVLYESGKKKVHTMSLQDLENRKKASKTSGGPSWKNWENEMYLAKTIKAVSKRIVMDFENETLKKAYAGVDIEDADFEVVDEKPRIQLDAGSVD